MAFIVTRSHPTIIIKTPTVEISCGKMVIILSESPGGKVLIHCLLMIAIQLKEYATLNHTLDKGNGFISQKVNVWTEFQLMFPHLILARD